MPSSSPSMTMPSMMTSEHRGLLTGEHFMLGDHACAEGAILAGCRFFAGYPITPATEIAELVAQRAR